MSRRFTHLGTWPRGATGLLFVWSLIATPASIAQVDAWRAHTSFRQVTALAASGGDVWVSTKGGVYRYAPGEGTFDVFTADRSLYSVPSQVAGYDPPIAYDPRREAVWIGYLDGVFDRLDVASGAVRTYRDVSRSRFTSREIRRFAVRGDTLLIATSFGVVVFDAGRGEVRDTYSQLGSFAPATPVHDVALGPTPSGEPGIWLATEQGVAYASLLTVNLQDPAAWTTEFIGLPSREARAAAFFGGRLYVGTDGGLAVRESGGSYTNLGVTSWPVTQLLATPDRLLGVERFSVLLVDASGSVRRMQVEGFADPVAVAEGPGGRLWVGDRLGGLLSVTVPPAPATQLPVEQSHIYPEGPFHGSFTDLKADGSGALWAAGGNGAGFYRLDPDGRWTSFISAFVPELEGRGNYERVHVDALGNAWAASAGSGVAMVTREGEVRTFDVTNSSLRSSDERSPNFVLSGGIASEKDGTVWVTNRGAPIPLHVRTADGQWTGFAAPGCSGFSISGLTLDRLFIDSFGQKWIIVRNFTALNRTLGLLVLDTGRSARDPQDDVCHFFSSKGSGGQGLPSPAVTSVVEDRDGLIWIGTEDGLAFMINSGIVAADRNAVPIWPQLADRSKGLFLLNGIRINDLAVDPANRLWVATRQGAMLVQQVEGGYEIASTFTTENSPLFSNDVVAVEVDPASGRVYFSTDRGLISYQGDAIAPSEQTRDLFVYPNPLRVSDGAEPSVVIEGLVEETELRILAPHGAVVARLTTRGGRARWDGRDMNNQIVPSGVYLVVAVGAKGEGTAYGKVAVIR